MALREVQILALMSRQVQLISHSFKNHPSSFLFEGITSKRCSSYRSD